jgi:hypothetical protein
MDKLFALAAFVLSLLGCEPQRSVFEHRTVYDGRDLLHARASVESGVARFECLESATGLCYWTVRRTPCRDAALPCTEPGTQFALAVDDSRQIAGLARVHLCVADRAGARASCEALGEEAR